MYCFRLLPCAWFRWAGKNGCWWSAWSSAVAPSSTFSPSSARGCSTRGKKRRSRDKPEKISWDSTTSTLLIDRCHFKYCFRAKRLSVDRVYNLKDFKIQNIFLLNFAWNFLYCLQSKRKITSQDFSFSVQMYCILTFFKHSILYLWENIFGNVDGNKIK